MEFPECFIQQNLFLLTIIFAKMVVKNECTRECFKKWVCNIAHKIPYNSEKIPNFRQLYKKNH